MLEACHRFLSFVLGIQVINPWRMHEGYDNRFVCVSVCLLPRKLLHTSFFRWNSGVIRLSVLFSTYALRGFC